MESRKAHRVGSKSLAVTLPSRWTHAVGLRPGDSVAFMEEADGSLALMKGTPRKGGERTAVLSISSHDPPGRLERLLIACYLVGFEVIKVRADGSITPEQLETLRNTVSRLTGLAVVENRADTFLARSYLDSSSSTVEEHIRRLLGLTETMLGEASGIVGRRDARAAREVLALGEQADRLYYLTVRSLLSALSDRAGASRMGIRSPQEAVGCRVIAKALEEICDSMETMAEVVTRTEGADWTAADEITGQVRAFTERISDQLRMGVEAFFAASAEDADTLLGEILDLERRKGSFVQEVIRVAPSPVSAAVLTVAGMALRDVCRFTRVIGEVALNNAVRIKADGPDTSATLLVHGLGLPRETGETAYANTK